MERYWDAKDAKVGFRLRLPSLNPWNWDIKMSLQITAKQLQTEPNFVLSPVQWAFCFGATSAVPRCRPNFKAGWLQENAIVFEKFEISHSYNTETMVGPLKTHFRGQWAEISNGLHSRKWNTLSKAVNNFEICWTVIEKWRPKHDPKMNTFVQFDADRHS